MFDFNSVGGFTHWGQVDEEYTSPAIEAGETIASLNKTIAALNRAHKREVRALQKQLDAVESESEKRKIKFEEAETKAAMYYSQLRVVSCLTADKFDSHPFVKVMRAKHASHSGD